MRLPCILGGRGWLGEAGTEWGDAIACPSTRDRERAHRLGAMVIGCWPHPRPVANLPARLYPWESCAMMRLAKPPGAMAPQQGSPPCTNIF